MQKDAADKVGAKKLLVVRSPIGWDEQLLEGVCSCFDVTTVAGVDEALSLLEEQKFDGVLSEGSGFLPLERAKVSHQAVAILNTLGEGVCLLGRDGTALWANRKMEEYLPVVKEGIAEHSRKAYEYFDQRIINGEKDLRSRRYSLTDKSTDRYFEMIITGMRDSQGDLAQVAAVVWDETASRRLQKRIDVIDKAGRELVRLESESYGGMTVPQRINVLQHKIIRYAKDLLHFDHFVVRVLNRQNNQLEVLFGVGLPGDEQTEVFANINNNGITGYVAATGRSYICNNPSTDSRYLPGLDGVASSLTVPLRFHDKIVGTLNVESGEEGAFTEDDRQMVEIFGRYIAIALNILDLLVVERYQTTGEAVGNLSQQVSDPICHIITEASMLMEEYIGHDDMRRRLQTMIDHATCVKLAVRDAQNGPKGIVGSRQTAAGSDSEYSELVGKHLLVVDDEQFIRETVADVVEKYGCIADMARDGREALALVKQRNYDLVVTDIKLPHASGYDIFAAAREKDHDIPVIIMTGFGYDPNHSIVRANREGLSAVLYKPFKVDQLMTEIRSAIRGDGQDAGG